eukprot:13123040-Ditylum_brightwellii.AAC.1
MPDEDSDEEMPELKAINKDSDSSDDESDDEESLPIAQKKTKQPATIHPPSPTSVTEATTLQTSEPAQTQPPIAASLLVVSIPFIKLHLAAAAPNRATK